jgi:hypothetical protein
LPALLGTRGLHASVGFERLLAARTLAASAPDRIKAPHRLGTALIHDNLTHIDAQRMPVYLESTNPVSLPRYEALGFRRRAEFGPVDGPLITTMWREAC